MDTSTTAMLNCLIFVRQTFATEPNIYAYIYMFDHPNDIICSCFYNCLSGNAKVFNWHEPNAVFVGIEIKVYVLIWIM